MRPPGDPVFRVVTLAALCQIYTATECRMLERVIAIMQRDTRAWLRLHPEHVHAFCDAYYECRDEIDKLVEEYLGYSVEWCGGYALNGIWTILGQRYESRQAHDRRMQEAGYITCDIDALMDERFTEEELQKMDAELKEMLQRQEEEIAADRDQDRLMGYSFWLPNREEDYGEFSVSFPKRDVERMDRIGDYRYAGGRFPAREYAEFFDDMLARNVISNIDHQNLSQWIAYESLPKLRREALKAASPYRSITDLPAVVEFKALVSDFDDESDELEDSELPAIVSSRHETLRILEGLESQSKQKD